MFNRIGTYWSRVAARAFRETWRSVFHEYTEFFVVAVLIAAIYVLLVVTFAARDEAGRLLMDRALEWLSPLLVFPGIFIFNLVRVPAEMNAEADAGLATLKPKLQLSFTKDQGIAPIEYGHILQSISGSRQMVSRAQEIFLRVMCTNVSAHRVEGCEAWLVGAMGIKDDGTLESIGFDEPYQLSWSHVPKSALLSETLQPGIPKPIYVLYRRPHPSLMLFQTIKQERLETGILFAKARKYRIWVQVNGITDTGDRICLDVWPIDPPGGVNQLPMFSMGAEVVSTGFGPEPLGVMKMERMSTYRA
jgi:hypothetical protein